MNDKTTECRRIPKLALTRREAAQALSVSDDTLDRLTKRGFIRAVRVSRRPLYAVQEIERFLLETTEKEWLK